MDWTQIETKWAAMTRRVRADRTFDTAADKAMPTAINVPAPRPAMVPRAALQHASRQADDTGPKTLAE